MNNNKVGSLDQSLHVYKQNTCLRVQLFESYAPVVDKVK